MQLDAQLSSCLVCSRLFGPEQCRRLPLLSSFMLNSSLELCSSKFDTVFEQLLMENREKIVTGGGEKKE